MYIKELLCSCTCYGNKIFMQENSYHETQCIGTAIPKLVFYSLSICIIKRQKSKTLLYRNKHKRVLCPIVYSKRAITIITNIKHNNKERLDNNNDITKCFFVKTKRSKGKEIKISSSTEYHHINTIMKTGAQKHRYFCHNYILS